MANLSLLDYILRTSLVKLMKSYPYDYIGLPSFGEIVSCHGSLPCLIIMTRTLTDLRSSDGGTSHFGKPVNSWNARQGDTGSGSRREKCCQISLLRASICHPVLKIAVINGERLWERDCIIHTLITRYKTLPFDHFSQLFNISGLISFFFFGLDQLPLRKKIVISCVARYG